MKLIVVAFLALLVPVDALACSCARPQPVDEAVENALRVFHGEVVSIEKLNPLSERVTFRVSEHFKGEPVETLQVDTPIHGPSCGYPFQEGSDYVVYAHGEGDWLATNSCSRTTLAVPGSDLDVLRDAD